MIEVNEELTQRVADLSRLALSPDEVRRYTEQLKKILGYIDQLNEVSVPDETVPLFSPLEFDAPLRLDALAHESLNAEGKPKILKSAPEVLYDGFKVPPIL